MILISLTVMTLLAFQQVKDCDFITQYDDDLYIVHNSHIQNGVSIEGIRWAFTTGYANFWHPLTWISHMLDVQFFGLNPRWHHLTNLFFHIANTLLLFLIFHRMTKAPWQSAFVAALFAIHPLHVESVAWVAERKDVLSTLFWMLTMGAYLLYVERPRALRYLAVVAFFALGLMAKPMLVTLPFVLLLLDFWPLERFVLKSAAPGSKEPAGLNYHWASIRPLLWEKTPLFCLAVISSIMAYITQQQGGAVIPGEVLPPGDRVANAFVSFIFYIDKMVWPRDLALLYPHPRVWPIWLVVGAALPIVAATFMVILRAKRFPYLALGWLWYLGTLVPVIGLVQVGSHAMADRYTYIPLIGLFIIVSWGIPDILKGWRHRKEAFAALSAMSLFCLAAVTWTQVGYWKNSLSLFDHTVNVTNQNVVMYNNRGLVYSNEGNYNRAIKDFDKAIEINPHYVKALINRGMTYSHLGSFDRAIEDFDKAVGIDPQMPLIHYSRGIAYGKLGNHVQALEDFDRAIELDSKYTVAYYDRGMAHGKLGQYDRAYEDLKTAARLGSEDAKNFLANHGVTWQ